MITIYMTSSCPSCRKAKKWLEANNLPYTVRNISSELITKEEIKKILLMTEEGTEEIISTRSKAYQELNMDLEALSLKELYTVISENPGVLRRPILIDNKRLQVGYNEEEIRRFLPRSVRTLELQQLLKIV